MSDVILPKDSAKATWSLKDKVIIAIIIAIAVAVTIGIGIAVSASSDGSGSYSADERASACAEASARQQLGSDPNVAARSSIGDLLDNAQTASQLRSDYDC